MKDKRLALARENILGYAVEMNDTYQTPEHIAQIAVALHGVMDGSIRRLIICEPPRHGKSELVSRILPAFYHGHFPHHFIMELTYSQELANGFGANVRDQLLDQRYRDIFQNTLLSGHSQAKAHYATTEGGEYYAIGLGGPLTGRGAHLLIVDDPCKNRKEAESRVFRETAKDAFKAAAYTRLEPDGAIVLMMTRWHDDDLVGWQLREHADEGWVTIILPALDDRGQALWPERFDAERLGEIKRMIGEYEWEALYQQRPSLRQGNVLHREWWDYYDAVPALDFMVQSWDMAFKKGLETDFVVGQVWGAKGADRFLLDQIRARMSFTETLEAFRRLTRKWPKTHTKYVEEKANGAAVIDTLKREISGIVPVNPDKKGNKLARANAVTPQIRSGNVFLPKPETQNWVYGFIDRCAIFKGVEGDVDDEIDAMTQALSEMDSGTAERLRRLLRM